MSEKNKRTREEMREVDRKYIKFKMKRVKREKTRGNAPAAERHADELVQYLGLDERELPIERIVDLAQTGVTSFSTENRLRLIREEGAEELLWN